MLWQEHSPFSLLNNYKHLPLLIKALLTVQLLGYVLLRETPKSRIPLT